MDGVCAGFERPPLHMLDDAGERIMRSNLSEPALRHAMELVTIGYTVIPKAFDRDHCQHIIAQFNIFYRNNDQIFSGNRSERGLIPRITNLHQVIPALSQLFTKNPILLEVQDFLFGRPTSLYTSLYYEKGSEQPLHRDTPVFCTRPEYNYFGNTLYLEDTGDENGCLEIVPGGHKLGELDREALARSFYGSLDAIPQLDNGIWNEYQKRVVDRCNALGLIKRSLHVSAGDCLIWHPQVPHGGSPIRDPARTRHSFVFHTAPVGARVYHQHAFFNPTKPYPEMATWEQEMMDGRAVVHHSQGIAFGDPVQRSLPIEELNLSGLAKVPGERVSTHEALRRLAPDRLA